jgi:hypothetical protein
MKAFILDRYGGAERMRAGDRAFPFASTREAMAYIEAGRARGKVVVSMM